MHKKVYLLMSLLVLPVSVLRAQEAESEDDVYRKPSCCVSLPLYGDVVGTTCDSRVAFVGGISAAQIAQCCSGSSGGSTAAGTCAATANTLALRDASGSILFNDIGVGVAAAIKAPSATEFYAGNNVGPAATICSTTRGPTGGAGSTAVGTNCLPSNTGAFNTAYGFAALNSNVAGASNTAVGFSAMSGNISAFSNTALGSQALSTNATGAENTVIGAGACRLGSPSFCTIVGRNALVSNSGNSNTAVGNNIVSASGSSNLVAVGANTEILSDSAIAIGSGATVPTASTSAIAIGSGAGAGGAGGVNSILIGANTQSGGDNAIAIGSGLTPPANTIYIGSDGPAYDRFIAKGIAGISLGTPGTAVVIADGAGQMATVPTKFFANGIVGVTTDVNDAIPVLIDSAGQLGTLSSSKRYKKDIQSLGDESSDIMKLRPVTFRYKTHSDTARRQYGLIAEEVNEVYPDLVIRNKENEIETVAYQHLPILTLSEVQKQHKKIEQLEAHIESQNTLIKEICERLSAVESRR